MSTAGSSERASSFPIGYPVGGAAMAVPVAMIAPVAKYTQADFERENAAFQGISLDRKNVLTLCFSRVVYDKADRDVAICAMYRDHPKLVGREGSVGATHVGIKVLNSIFLNPGCPVDRNPGLVLQSLSKLLPKDSSEIVESVRTEMRSRAINLVFNFYPKAMKVFIDYLVQAKQAATPKAALLQLTQNAPCGNLVDAAACQMARTTLS